MEKVRKKIRFPSDNKTTALISFNTESIDDVDADLVALLINESLNGCCLASANHDEIKEGNSVMVVCGSLAPMRAEVKWVKKIDSEVLKYGLEYEQKL